MYQVTVFIVSDGLCAALHQPRFYLVHNGERRATVREAWRVIDLMDILEECIISIC